MTVGMSAYLANKLLDAVGNAVSFSVAQAYVQLHTADPGAAGTTAVATETTRKAVSFGAAAAGSMANDVAITWTGIAGSQDASHFTLWDAATVGNFLGSGIITANAYTAGDNYTVGVGGFVLQFTLAA
jgi:hypothetical protein